MSLLHGPGAVMDNLSLYLDAANTRSYPGSGTAWTDLTANRTAATLTNGPTFTSSNGGAIVFDGTNDYASLPNVPALALSGTSFSIESWIYLTGYAAAYSGFYTGAIYSSTSTSSSNGGNFGLQFTISGTVSSFTSLGIYANNGSISNGWSYSFNLNTWYHIVMTHSSAGAWIPYINTVVQATYTKAGTWTDNFTAAIGRNNQTNYNYYLPARVPIFKVYSAVLTADQVTQNYNATRARFGV